MAGRSIDTALHCVVNKIEKAFSVKEYALGLFLDIEGAFDKVNLDVIHKALVEFGVELSITGWTKFMLGHRRIQVENGRHPISASVRQGCPQGGVLSPLIWSLVVNSLLVRLNSEGYFTVGYADDIVILVIGKHLNTITEVAQQALSVCER